MCFWQVKEKRAPAGLLSSTRTAQVNQVSQTVTQLAQVAKIKIGPGDARLTGIAEGHRLGRPGEPWRVTDAYLELE